MRMEIKLVIVKSGCPQYAIAQELGVPESRLSKFIRGHGLLRPDQECRLLRILGLHLEEGGGAGASHQMDEI
jgi:plasmid maintenance system antidote protein VapI